MLEQWGVPLAVFAMLLLTLVMAAVLNRYQAFQANVRVAVRRLDVGVAEVTAALDGLGRVPLSRELRLTLRSDILARYRKIRRLYRRYPAIDTKIRAAEAAINAEGGAPSGGVGPMENEQIFRKTIAALDCLIATLGGGHMLQPLPADVRVIFRRELGERRAEAMSRFHLVEAKRHERQGNATRSRTHLIALVQALRQRGPGTGFVRELLSEAESALASLNEGRLNSQAMLIGVDAA